MTMLADLVELVTGVDTHKQTHTAAVVTATTGAVLAQATVSATRLATASCWHWLTSSRASASGRSKAPAAMALA
jgi:hypothetical protein